MVGIKTSNTEGQVTHYFKFIFIFVDSVFSPGMQFFQSVCQFDLQVRPVFTTQ